jgi:hypothetical protein
VETGKRLWKGKKGSQLTRMKAVCHTASIFNPLYVLDNKISVSDIEIVHWLHAGTLLANGIFQGKN